MAKGVYTTDFHQEYAAETSRIIRDRFVWLCALVVGFTLLFSLQRVWNDLVIPLLQLIRGVDTSGWDWGRPVGGLPDAITIGVFGLIGWRAWIGRFADADLMRFAVRMIQCCGAFAMLLYPVYTRERVLPIESVFLMHVIACACLPWSLKDAIRPMLPLLGLSAAMILVIVLSGGVSMARVLQAVGLIVFSPLVLAPGAIVATIKDKWRTELFRTRFFESRYGQMRRELVDARTLHEALFPKAETRDGIRLDYRYEPVRQIGGDFIFARWTPERPDDIVPPGQTPPNEPRVESLTVVLLDVTGHGLSSALTVNRISGELERLFAEDPATGPGEVLRALNRYVYLTLAPHAIYATAMVARVDRVAGGDSCTLRYANAGHPPAFVLGSVSTTGTDGVTTLDPRLIPSTAPMLGVLSSDEFDPDPRTMPLRPGERFIAYTDGAVETKNVRGDLFGVERMRTLLSPRTSSAGASSATLADPALGWSQTVINAVDAFRSGLPTDDTVVVEIALLWTNPGPAMPRGVPLASPTAGFTAEASARSTQTHDGSSRRGTPPSR
ncbi:MAG: serine/threonine-protein phosphatase [Phycisphaerales bacterium]|nr:serine/threonine-protein phosphatase [Phycisphaerales bacterium]